MTTTVTQGYSRVVDYGTGTYDGFEQSTITFQRQDGQGDFVYSYNWIDDTNSYPPMVMTFDPWSLTAVVDRPGADPVDLVNGNDFVERQVFSVAWGEGKETIVYALFQPVEGIETYFFIGGDTPEITSEADLEAFLANPHSQVLTGPYEGGEAIPLSGFANTTVTEDDVITAVPGLPLEWNAGVGNDTVTGGDGNDTLMGGAGNDVMTGAGASDSLWGDGGNDTLTGSGDHSVLLGGAGDDVLLGGAAWGDLQDGGGGNDLIQMSDGQDFGGGMWISHSTANGGSGNDTITGGKAGDMASGGADADLVSGLLGDDQLSGNAGDDTLLGGDGNDTVTGGTQNDSLLGGAGNDSLSGGDGDDSLSGEAGADTVLGEAGKDLVSGGNGNDSLYGGSQNDQLRGDVGADKLYGDDGNDLLWGGDQNDRLEGGKGNDTLQGDAGADVLLGQAGADLFVFGSTLDSPTAAMDTISGGFTHGSDRIDLHLIDARAGTAGDQAFTFVGGAAFTAEGQVRVTESGGDTLVEVNTTGADGAEMAFLLRGVTGMVEGDFIL